MTYGRIILLLRFIFYIYRLWYIYESNHAFVFELKQSKTYNSMLSMRQYTDTIQSCANINIEIPYTLRLSELTLSEEAYELYDSVYKMTQCIHDPEIVTKHFFEFIHKNKSKPISTVMQVYDPSIEVELSYNGLQELYKMSNDLDYFSKKMLLSNMITISEYQQLTAEYKIRNAGTYKNTTNSIIVRDHWYYIHILTGATIEIGEEAMNYLFYTPTHTPLYDKFTLIQQKMKAYYRYLDESYRQINYLAIDIMDELSIFTSKFHSSIQSTIHLYYSTGFLLAEITGYMYGSDNAILVIEGLNMVRMQIE